ncbi:Sulfite exporter TauE/SafE family protein 3 [Bienertia sinuspersici]
MGKSGLMKIVLISTILVGFLLLFVSANEETLKQVASTEIEIEEVEVNLLRKAINFLWQSGQNTYTHVWPDMEFNWQIVVGSLIGFFGASFGSVGGVGGGGIFVPMLTLIIGFDSKSSTAMSKSVSTVYYNLKQRHMDMPVIDYDLALLFQPVLVLGIITSTKAFLKGVDAWKKETIMKKEAAQRLLSEGDGGEYKAIPSAPEKRKRENVHWPSVGILFAVWFVILGLQFAQKNTTTCSAAFWITNLLQIPVALGASGYEAYLLYTGKRVIASRGAAAGNWKLHQLFLCLFLGMTAGMVGGLLGLGGGFILGPLFLELSIPPQVSSATATFAMMFSSSMSVVEYYLLKRFPVPYAAYFVGVATFAALVGQILVRRLIAVIGRASLIIFILAFTIFAE